MVIFDAKPTSSVMPRTFLGVLLRLFFGAKPLGVSEAWGFRPEIQLGNKSYTYCLT